LKRVPGYEQTHSILQNLYTLQSILAKFLKMQQ
jgi:hypothetical protein